ncbi:hypothetical protein GQ457_03G021700 [Hibiscus cannabinus]
MRAKTRVFELPSHVTFPPKKPFSARFFSWNTTDKFGYTSSSSMSSLGSSYLLKQFLGALFSNSVIVPQSIWLVGSSISEHEEEVEFEALLEVISNSNNKIRLDNSVYNEIIGQLEWP